MAGFARRRTGGLQGSLLHERVDARGEASETHRVEALYETRRDMHRLEDSLPFELGGRDQGRSDFCACGGARAFADEAHPSPAALLL